MRLTGNIHFQVGEEEVCSEGCWQKRTRQGRSWTTEGESSAIDVFQPFPRRLTTSHHMSAMTAGWRRCWSSFRIALSPSSPPFSRSNFFFFFFSAYFYLLLRLSTGRTFSSSFFLPIFIFFSAFHQVELEEEQMAKRQRGLAKKFFHLWRREMKMKKGGNIDICPLLRCQLNFK